MLMNGITLQLTGEILYCPEEETAGLYNHRATYLTCLEDFVFASLFSDEILVTGEMPVRGGESPGNTLKKNNIEFITAVNAPNSSPPDALLADKESRESISEKIKLLCTRFNPENQIYFTDWMTMEALSDLGDHESLL